MLIKMDLSNGSSQSYWFILRDDQNSTQPVNEFALQEQISPVVTSYLVDSEIPKYIQDLDSPQENYEKQLTNIIQPPSTCNTYKLNEDSKEWTTAKIELLLQITPADKYGNYEKERDIWKQVSDSIGITAQACAKKYRNLRNIYIRLAKRRKIGRKVKWLHYNLCDKHFKNSKTIPNLEHKWDEPKIVELLSLYVEKLPKLKNSEINPSEVWNYIATKLGTTEYNCYTKFQHIKRSHYRYLERIKKREKNLKWPYYNYCERIFSTYTRSNWNQQKIKLLIQTYMQFASQFQDRSYVKKDLWNKISKIVGESAFNCDRKFRNLKQTYSKLKSLIATGKSTKWIFFKDFETLSRITNSYNQNTIAERSINNHTCKIHKLLNFVVKNKEKFQNTIHKKKVLWKEISKQLGMCPEECYSKYRNLKQTYVRLLQNKKLTGKDNNWPYYPYFECIYGQIELKKSILNKNNQKSYKEQEKEYVSYIFSEKDEKFDKLIQKLKQSNEIQKERNRILKAIIDSR